MARFYLPNPNSTVTPMMHTASGKDHEVEPTGSEHASVTDATGGEGDNKPKNMFEVVEHTPTTNVVDGQGNKFEATVPDSVSRTTAIIGDATLSPIYYGESDEHEKIGDLVKLKFENNRIVSGKKWEYKVEKETLTYGLIVALAGDFYGNYRTAGDVEQISDNWDSARDRSIALGIALAKTLSGDTAKYLSPVLTTMGKERDEIRTGMEKGKYVAQIYNDFGDKYGLLYNSDTKKSNTSLVGAYLLLAQCNWDHFGKDAEKAYSALHSGALLKAKEAYDAGPSRADEIMKEAYFLEAYGQHFLTDLFSSGHLRTPRRALHSTLTMSEGPRTFAALSSPETLYPQDFCARRMHDEDCANGLWVRNSKGKGWAAYGDKQLLSAKSNQNFQMALNAAQAGLDEVWETRLNGNIPAIFTALNLTPILSDELNWRNFCPMFRVDGTSAELVYRRAFDNRSEFALLKANPTNTQWSYLLGTLKDSGPQRNMYPWTEGFFSETAFVQLRVAPSTPSSFLESRYGPLKTEEHGSTWTMVEQFNSPLKFDLDETWISAAALTSDVRALVTRIRERTDGVIVM
ncbi:hypothetical protein B0H14DRAFT_1655844 [Mycena olivaceomarginata]|nr:hypothetical protein B0H14DRAFT_1655844 [Mycena olivaceomarginata]